MFLAPISIYKLHKIFKEIDAKLKRWSKSDKYSTVPKRVKYRRRKIKGISMH
jgi:hypothetical protein